jgi:hypothetical protein
MINGKYNRNIYEMKAMILMNNNLPVTPDNLHRLDGLWDNNGNYDPGNIKPLINLIKETASE